jgi:hypothetical protein
MYEFFKNLDRRWIFLMMFLAVAVPIIVIGVTKKTFPEVPTKLAMATFHEIDRLGEGDPVLLSFDFDPGSEGELGPMATAFVRHCCEKKLRMYFMALWPVGPQMIEETINKIIKADFPHLVYGVDYVNLGFKSGNEGVIKVIVTDLRQLYTTDAAGTSLDNIPMMSGIRNIRQMKLIVNVSAGYAGTKEWVQYAVTPYQKEGLRMVAGCTGVQAPLLYPYIPEQLPGLLGAIKGAAEYEALVLQHYGQSILVSDERGEKVIPGKYLEGQRRMGPQLVAHVLMILLIIAGNVIFFIEKKRERQR